MARKPAASRATRTYEPHVFAENLYGPRDHHDESIECLRCPLPRGNAVHISSGELAAALPPVPAEDVSDRILGEAAGG
jgi:hypothetical protein